jgi:hypothetical protein
MALLTRKRTVLAKIETSYGVDPNPAGSADAILVKNLNLTPLNAETVSRDLIRPYLGNSETLLATSSASIDFEVEIAGSGATGKLPGYDCLLRACGFEATTITEEIDIERVGQVATATLAAHGFSNGDRVKISGAGETEYNGEFEVYGVTANTFDFTVVGTPATPATGTPVVGKRIEYKPVSEGIESVTLHFHIDSVRHVLAGARGTVEFSISARQIPVMRFTFTGLYSTPTDTPAPTADFSKFQLPQVANTQFTTNFSLHGYAGVLESMSLNLANDVQYLSRIGQENVLILNRQPAGTFLIEAPTIATKDFFTLARNATPGLMTITQGTVGGNKVKIEAGSVTLQNPSYQDTDGVHFLSIPFTAQPVSGNDEIVLTVF